jgi:hypothetical protein
MGMEHSFVVDEAPSVALAAHILQWQNRLL